jgi:hypothetical protein
MTVHLDTSALVDSLTGPRRSLEKLVALAEQGHRLSLSAVVNLLCRRSCFLV